MASRAIQTDDAPKVIGPYSQGLIAQGEMIFTSGQVGLVPATGELVEGGVAEQTRQALTNLQNVLAAAGSTMNEIVRTTVYLTTMDNFAAMNAVYAEFFADTLPTRSTVAVVGLPKGALVEIDAIALRTQGPVNGPHWFTHFK